jgi:hypothetical protein
MKDTKLLIAISKIASLSVVALLIAVSVLATYSYLDANSGPIQTVSVTAKLTTTNDNSSYYNYCTIDKYCYIRR